MVMQHPRGSASAVQYLLPIIEKVNYESTWEIFIPRTAKVNLRIYYFWTPFIQFAISHILNSKFQEISLNTPKEKVSKFPITAFWIEAVW